MINLLPPYTVYACMYYTGKPVPRSTAYRHIDVRLSNVPRRASFYAQSLIKLLIAINLSLDLLFHFSFSRTENEERKCKDRLNCHDHKGNQSI